MSEIPEELKGWKAYADAKRTASNAYDASLIEFGFEDQLRILKAIEYGVLLERQRCAKVADDMEAGAMDDFDNGFNAACYRISQAILNQTEE